MEREEPKQTNYKSQTDDILSLSSCNLVCVNALFLSQKAFPVLPRTQEPQMIYLHFFPLPILKAL